MTLERLSVETTADVKVGNLHVMLIPRMQSINEIMQKLRREALRVKRKSTTKLHVIDVRPHCLERNVIGAVVANDSCNLINIAVTILA